MPIEGIKHFIEIESEVPIEWDGLTGTTKYFTIKLKDQGGNFRLTIYYKGTISIWWDYSYNSRYYDKCSNVIKAMKPTFLDRLFGLTPKRPF